MFIVSILSLLSILLVNIDCSPVPVCTPNLKLGDSKICSKYYECVLVNGEFKLEERYCENGCVFDQTKRECLPEHQSSTKCKSLTLVGLNSIPNQIHNIKPTKSNSPIRFSKNWIAIYIKCVDEDELEEENANKNLEIKFSDLKPNVNEKKNEHYDHHHNNTKVNCSKCHNEIKLDENNLNKQNIKPTVIVLPDQPASMLNLNQPLSLNIKNKTLMPDTWITDVKSLNTDDQNKLLPNSTNKSTIKQIKLKPNIDLSKWNSNIVIHKRKPSTNKPASS